jgi:pimeloyl-ACP methyl ester carboxylesterase
MEKGKGLLIFTAVWLLLNLIAYVMMREKGYLVSWGLFGLLTMILVISLLVIFVGIIIWIIKISSGNSLYYINKVLFKTIIWTFSCIWLLFFQVIISEFMVISPGSGQNDIVKVEINDSEQYYSIRTKDISNPIILFLAGGPGGSQIPTTRTFLSQLERDYTIINWEQPGVGKSYDAIYRNIEFTPMTYVLDAHALTQHLKSKYHQEKIYIIGESWGSYLGILLASLYPEDYYAMIGTGQMVDFTETEIYCYQYALNLARENQNTKFEQKLLDLGTPPIYGKNISLALASYLQPLYMHMENDPNISHQNWDTFKVLFAPEYSILNTVNYAKGLYYTFSNIYQQLYGQNLRETHTSFQIPIYFLHGRHDVNAPGYLVQDYYALIDAPDKALIWFEQSGHNPWIDEYQLFNQNVLSLFIQHME